MATALAGKLIAGARALTGFYASPTGALLLLVAVAACVLAAVISAPLGLAVLVGGVVVIIPHRLVRLEHSRSHHWALLRQELAQLGQADDRMARLECSVDQRVDAVATSTEAMRAELLRWDTVEQSRANDVAALGAQVEEAIATWSDEVQRLASILGSAANDRSVLRAAIEELQETLGQLDAATNESVRQLNEQVEIFRAALEPDVATLAERSAHADDAVAAAKRDVTDVVTREARRVSLTLARRDSLTQPIEAVLLLLCPPRVGSTLLFDVLRSHPLIEMHSSADLYRRLGVAGRRYPGHLTDLDASDRQVEVQVELGGRVPRSVSIASISTNADQTVHYLEKIHPQAFDFAADAFAGRVERLRHELGGERTVLPIYLAREPGQSIRSFVSYRHREPGWHANVAVESAYDYYRSSYETLSHLFGILPGPVVAYEQIVDAPGEAIGSVLVRLGIEPPELAATVADEMWLAGSKRASGGSPFFGAAGNEITAADVELGQWTDDPRAAREALAGCRHEYRQLLARGSVLTTSDR